ncbi:MAG: DUF177 domain-containing protein [Pseudomonadota bacterium]
MTVRNPSRLRLASLRKDVPTAFDYAPDEATLAALRDRLDLLGLRKVRLRGEIAPEGRADWRLTAQLGATVQQPCTVTLEPVTTRIDEPVARLYLAGFRTPSEAETEMPEDDTQEPLPDAIALDALTEEALALALPAFPRHPGAAPFEASAAPPGAAPLDDTASQPSPFAGLADLKRKLDD